jgi:hypothetical protein
VLEQSPVDSQDELLAVAGVLLKGIRNRSNDGCVVRVGALSASSFHIPSVR